MDDLLSALFLGDFEKIAAYSFPPPDPPTMLYAHPNPDGSRKKCENCWKWTRDEHCLEVKGKIGAKQVCGYHVYGPPQDKFIALGVALVGDELAGLISTQDGTSCDICMAFVRESEKGGHCMKVYSDGKPARVEAKGCCNGWHERK